MLIKYILQIPKIIHLEALILLRLFNLLPPRTPHAERVIKSYPDIYY